jgi:hypothetical protein
MDMPDDCEFSTIQPLDKLYDFYKSSGFDKLIISSRMMTNGEDQSHFAHRFFADDDNSPIMPLCGLMLKKFYHDLGGMDKNFIAVMWSLDVAMRVYASGGRVMLSDVYVNEYRDRNAGSNLCGEFWEHDRSLLERLWTTGGKLHFNRKNPVDSFSDVNILNASQGPRGRWRGNGPILFDKTGDIMGKCGSIIERVNRGIRKPSMYFDYAKRVILRLKRKS